jgi:predicted O-methyltransferase YrrM
MGREHLCEIIDDLELTGIGAEIGVHEGEFSDVILSNTKMSMLISIDIWKKQYCMNQAFKRLQKHDLRSTMIRQNSLVAAQMFPDNFFDFIYIDSWHVYKHTKKELDLYWPKLKTGGIFSGHDYVEGWKDQSGVFHPYGVIQAVDEFVKRERQTLNLIDPNWPSWWLIKETKDHIMLQ